MGVNEWKERQRSPAYPMVYAGLLPMLREAALQHGYALGAHGSMQRDLDLIACPWTNEAADAETLIEALRETIGGTIFGGSHEPTRCTRKPHGRRGYSIYFSDECTGPYLDVSVMPRVDAPAEL